MTVHQQIRAAGLNSIVQISVLTDQDVKKLRRWAKDRPKLFEIILFGCKKRLESQQTT